MPVLSRRTFVFALLGVAVVALFLGMALFAGKSHASEVRYAKENGLAVRQANSANQGRLIRAVNANWAGYTPSTYTGSLGGVKGGNAACQSAYPGSHWMGVQEVLMMGSEYPWTSNAWLIFSAQGAAPTYASQCVSWQSSSVSYTGPYAALTTLDTTTCNSSFKLGCAYGGVDDEG
jgi:hypothetical protein